MNIRVRDDVESIKPLSMPLTEDDVEELFKLILKRPTGNAQFCKNVAASGMTIGEFIRRLRDSEELATRLFEQGKLAELDKEKKLDGRYSEQTSFRIPRDLQINKAPVEKVLLVGSCFGAAWASTIQSTPPTVADMYHIVPDLPALPKHPINEYNFQIVQLPLRGVIPDASFARLSQADIAGHEQLFQHGVKLLRTLLGWAMHWNKRHGILTFVVTFITPQQNFIGRLLPRYDLRNPVYFVEKLNEELTKLVAEFNNTYVFDINDVMSTYGRKYSQEDMMLIFNHGSVLGNFGYPLDKDRLEPPPLPTDVYRARVDEMLLASWNEIVAMYRTLRQVDMVKMVVIDLDDTLWRGVIADTEVDNLPTSEGWPKGFWEALAVLKRRGVILAIISKNEESKVRQVWGRILGKFLKLEDFAIYKINWEQKSKNMEEILSRVNLLPQNVVYIDDNPAQRADIKSAFPGIRVLGGMPSSWRHILLWAPETQGAEISSESMQRTEMVKAQVEREEQRRNVSTEEFMASLGVQVSSIPIDDVTHPRFNRAFELINKTNQFNTTGKRWTREECISAFKRGDQFYAYEVSDRYTDYGLVAVLVLDDLGIRQFVMSCRVMSMDVEIAAIAHAIEPFRTRGKRELFAEMVHTDKNLPCQNVYARCGFEAVERGWRMDLSKPLPIPAHVTLKTAEGS